MGVQVDLAGKGWAPAIRTIIATSRPDLQEDDPMRSSIALALMLTAVPLVAAEEDAALVRARAILKSAPIVDGHNDVPWAIRESETHPRDVDAYDLRRKAPGQTDLPRLRQGGVGGQFWSVYIPAEDKAGHARTQLEQIELAKRMI